MLRAVALLAFVGTAAAETERQRVDAMVDALPQLATLEHGRARVVVHGAVAKRRDVLRVTEQVLGDVARRFTQNDGAAHAAIRLCLLSDVGRYREAARAFDSVPSDWGFYRPDLRVAIANLGASIGNLRHELVHPLIGDDFPAIPAWLNEGIAALYGTARWDGKRFQFLVNYRLADLQAAIEAGTLPTIAQLAASTADDVRGDRAMTYYAMSRYVLLFVEQRGQLSALYADLRGAERSAHAKILAGYVDDATFIAWAKKLRRPARA